MLRLIFLYLITLLLFFHAHTNELPRAGFFSQGAVLYWQAEEEGLSYAVESSKASNLSGRAKAIRPEFDWDFGFNVGVGYRVPHDRWQLLLQYTSFQTHSDAEKTAKEGGVFFPLWLAPAPAAPFFASEVKQHWRLHLGLIDFLVSRPYAATSTLTLTPQIGIRWGSARQKFHLEYRGGNFPPEGDVSIRMKNKFWGLGPYAGLIGEYAMAKGFSLCAQGAVSLLYGEFYLHQDEKTLVAKEKLLGLHSIYRVGSPILEGTAGIRWQHFFSGALKRLTLDLAWDQLLLFSQNQLLRFVDNAAPGITVSNQGDLSIAGPRFTFAFDF